ncbi:MAG: M48 family metalloprotease [Alphaproteobacteria bacterium]|nr:M48 family metalloprotease [Alphaproteobacteria bacterium]
MIKKLVTPIFEASGAQPNDIKFYILLDDNINAFVYNGRNIFISTELIAAFNDPDVLKGVVAHELGHIQGGHLARRDEKIREIQKQSMIAMGLLGAVAAVSGNADAVVGGALGQSHLFSRDYLAYSRSQEAAADQAAVRFLHDSQNSVIGILNIQKYFSRKEQEFGEINPYSVTHPLSSNRLASLKIAYDKENKSFGSSDEERKIYARIVAKLRGFLMPVTRNSKIYQEDLDPFAVKYQRAILLYERNDTAAAIKIINELIDRESENGYLYELKGQILFRAGDLKGAIASYKKSISYVDNPITKAEYAVVLANSVDYFSDEKKKKMALREVVGLLEEVLASNMKNPYIYRILATAYGKLGDLGYTNLMLAEEALMQRRYEDASRFAKLAEKYSKNRARLKIKIEDIISAVRNLNVTK